MTHAAAPRVVGDGLPQDSLTLEQWDGLEFAEGQRFELVEGMLWQMAPARPKHMRCARQLTNLLNEALSPEWTAEMEVKTTLREDPPTVWTPDVVVIPTELYEVNPARIAAADATLVVEVVSPSSKFLDLRAKRFEYEEAGIPHYWVIDLQARNPDERLFAWELVDGFYRPVPALVGERVSFSAPCPIDFAFADLLKR